MSGADHITERPLTKKKVLLVDDSPTALFMERLMLQRESYQIVTACDGQDAVEKAGKEQPDIIVMDVMMPRMTGFEACREIKLRPETRHIPVVLVTTRGEGANVQAGFEAGCNDYVTKPVDAQELLTKVRNHLGH